MPQGKLTAMVWGLLWQNGLLIYAMEISRWKVKSEKELFYGDITYKVQR